MDYRPSPRRRDSSPPRGPRIGGSEYFDHRQSGRGNSKYRDNEVPHQDRDRDRDNSRSPRDSYRDHHRRSSLDRQVHCDSSAKKYPETWNIYRPDYSAREKTSSVSRGHHNSPSRAGSPSPLHVADRKVQSRSTEDSMAKQSWKDRPQEVPKTTNATPPGATNGSRDSSINPSRSTMSTKVDQIQDENPLIPGIEQSKLAPLATGEVQISPTSPPKSSPQTVVLNTISSIPPIATMELVPADAGNEATAEALAVACKELANGAATLAALESSLSAATEILNKRTLDLERTKQHHQKFPDLEDLYKSNLKEADRKVKSLKARVKEQELVVSVLASRMAKQPLADIFARVQQHRAADHNAIDRIDKTCNGFKDLLERREKLNEKLQRENEESNNRLLKMEEELKALKVQPHVLQEQMKLQDTVNSLIKELAEAKTNAARIEARLDGQGLDISTLSSRTGSLSDTQKQVKELKENAPWIDKQIKDISSTCITLTKKVVDLEPLKCLDNRLQAVESQPDILSSIESRVQNLERLTPRPTPDITTQKELEALKDRIKRVEQTPSPRPTPVPANAQLDLDPSTLSRLQDLERAIGAITNGKDAFVKEDRFASLEDQMRTILDPDFEARISALEGSQHGRAASAAATPSGGDDFRSELENRLKAVENTTEELSEVQEALMNSISECVSDGLKLAAIETDQKFDSINNHVATLQSDLGRLSSAYDTIQTTVSAIKNPAAGLESKFNTCLSKITQTFNVETNRVTMELQRLSNESQGLNHSLYGIRTQIDNMNTSQFVAAMSDHFSNLYPHLKNNEAAFQELHDGMIKLNERVNKASETQFNQTQKYLKLANEMPALIETVNATKVDLEQAVGKFHAEHAKLEEQVAKNEQAVIDNFETHDEKVAALGTSIKVLDTTVKDLDKSIKDQDVQIQNLKRMTMRATPQPQAQSAISQVKGTSTPSRLNPNGTSNLNRSASHRTPPTEGLRPIPRQDSQSPRTIPRQASMASIASTTSESANKLKRKKFGVSNGNSKGSSSNSNTPERKKPRVKAVPDSDDEDPNFDPEDEIPQPHLDSEDE